MLQASNEYIEKTGENAFSKAVKSMGGEIGFNGSGTMGSASSFGANKSKFTYNAWGKKEAPKPKAEAPKETYKVGDTIEHSVFGRGKVNKVTPMSNDAMLEIEFESGITKKIMANFAKLEKL